MSFFVLSTLLEIELKKSDRVLFESQDNFLKKEKIEHSSYSVGNKFQNTKENINKLTFHFLLTEILQRRDQDLSR